MSDSRRVYLTDCCYAAVQLANGLTDYAYGTEALFVALVTQSDSCVSRLLESCKVSIRRTACVPWDLAEDGAFCEHDERRLFHRAIERAMHEASMSDFPRLNGYLWMDTAHLLVALLGQDGSAGVRLAALSMSEGGCLTDVSRSNRDIHRLQCAPGEGGRMRRLLRSITGTQPRRRATEFLVGSSVEFVGSC